MAGGVQPVMESYLYKGELHYLIDPSTRAELEKALVVVRELQELIDANDDETRINIELQAEQESMIKRYVDVLGEFDAAIFQKNIGYLVKQRGMRMSELENCLGISPGYISRTMRENTGKRMSIDMAWKVARLLDANLHTMISEDMQNQRGNTALILRFLERLTELTRDSVEQWQLVGGYIAPVDDILIDNEVVKTVDGQTYYWAREYSEDDIRPLAGDIMRLPGFIGGKEDLYIVPFKEDDDCDTEYEFIAATNYVEAGAKSGPKFQWRVFFFRDEALESTVEFAAQKLYDTICDMRFDVKVAPKDKTFIQDFLNN